MSDFPKWLLALAGISLLPVLLSPFYLFGASPFGTSDSAFLRFLLYICTQLLWLLAPVIVRFSASTFTAAALNAPAYRWQYAVP